MMPLFYWIYKHLWNFKKNINIFVLLYRRDLEMEWQEIEVVCVADIFLPCFSGWTETVDKSGMDCVVLCRGGKAA